MLKKKDGIMGMENADTSFWHQMYHANKITVKAFALCFSRPAAAEREGTEAGAMTLGGADTRLHHTPMVYSSSDSGNGSFFSVHVRAVHLRHGNGGESALKTDPDASIITLNVPEQSLNAGGVIVDSGTTDTYWNSNIRQELRKTFEQLSGKAFNHDKVRLSPEELASLPTILFQISGDEIMNKQVVADSGKPLNEIAGLAGDLDLMVSFSCLIRKTECNGRGMFW
jgi:hypothetical protein